jgi:putative permease
MPTKNVLVKTISAWFQRNFSDAGTIGLIFTLIIGILAIEFFGKLLLPILISIVIAYLLASLVRLLKTWKVPNFAAVIIVYSLFIGLLVLFVFVILPALWDQLSNLVTEVPKAFSHSQQWAAKLIGKYPTIFSDTNLQHITVYMQQESMKVGQVVLQYSFAIIPNVIEIILYLILVPLLVFFFLKDRRQIIRWCRRFLPGEESLSQKVWLDVNDKIGAYVRGRVLEIIIVGIVTSLAFAFLRLQYAALLGALVGLSVIIPYIGAAIVTIPIVIIALMQWGVSAHFVYTMLAFATILFLDGYLLQPFLFSEAMDLHPVVIIVAVIFFGGIWGFWGVFFAIPLATLVDAVLRLWPRQNSL